MNATEKVVNPKKTFSEYEISEPKQDGPMVKWDILDTGLDVHILIEYDYGTEQWSGFRSSLDPETDEFGIDVEDMELAEVDEIIATCELIPPEQIMKKRSLKN